MANQERQSADENRIRATALRQAKDIEDKKHLKNRIADLVVETFDLPSTPNADAAKPSRADALLFKHALSLFQPSDLDDLIYERNVDNRCGYALCPEANLKLDHGGDLVWNQKGGKDFKLVDRLELEKWCSKACQERTAFVRAQLGTEPAWLRVIRAVDIKLLDEVGAGGLMDSFKNLAIAQQPDDEMNERMQALALERGELNVGSDDGIVSVVERPNNDTSTPPSLPGSQRHGAVEVSHEK